MKSTNQLLVLIFSLCVLQACNQKKEELQPDYPKKPGYVSFTLGGTTLPNNDAHTITLFGCNTALIKDSANWHGPKTFQWRKSNQVLSGVPFGVQTDTANNQDFYINKYYVASPPVFGKIKEDGKDSTLYDIGLVVPDQFIFDGESPVQNIFLDYNILEPSFIHYIPIDFDASIDSLGVGYIPFKVECSNYPWIDTDRIKDGKGASGIGSLKQHTHSTQLFLPYLEEDGVETILNCDVTLLNDIMLYHEIKFIIDGTPQSQVDLKNYHKKYGKKPILIKAFRRPKDSIPSGCVKPIAIDGPYGK
jgi:hypothetical protein